MMICNECETVAHCSKHGCIPKRDFWEGYVPEPVKPAQQALDKMAGFDVVLDESMPPNTMKFVSPGGGYVPAIPAQQRTWRGLTDEEYIHITDSVYHKGQGLVAYYNAIEAKLKEKNT